MLVSEHFKRELWHYVILVLLLMFTTTPVQGFILKHISFLGVFGSYVAQFVSMLVLLIVADKILHKALDI